MTTPPDDAVPRPDEAPRPDEDVPQASESPATDPAGSSAAATAPPQRSAPVPSAPAAPGQAWVPSPTQPEASTGRSGIRPVLAAHPVVVGAVVAVLAAGGAFAGGYAVGHGAAPSGERARFELEGEMPFPGGDPREFLDELPGRPDDRTRPDSGGLEELDPSDGSAGSSDDATGADT